MLTFIAGVVVDSISSALVVAVFIGGNMRKTEEEPAKAEATA